MNGRLRGLGRTTWEQARPHLATLTCAWADLDGFHVGPPPDERPVATHLWAWSPQRWARARFDGDEVITALLDRVDNADATATGPGEPVTVTTRPLVVWADDERLPQPLPPELPRDLLVLEAGDLYPLAFVTAAGVMP